MRCPILIPSGFSESFQNPKKEKEIVQLKSFALIEFRIRISDASDQNKEAFKIEETGKFSNR